MAVFLVDFFSRGRDGENVTLSMATLRENPGRKVKLLSSGLHSQLSSHVVTGESRATLCPKITIRYEKMGLHPIKETKQRHDNRQNNDL